jgi:multiple sugar transport system permease protein
MRTLLATRVPGSVTSQRRRGARGKGLFGLLLTLPALVFYAVFILYPLVHSVGMSLFEDDLFVTSPRYIGLQNFRRLIHSSQLTQALPTTLTFVALSTLLAFALGLCWAIVLNQDFRGRSVLRGLSLLPWVLPGIVTAFLWAWMFNAQYGVVNAFLLKTGIIHAPVPWLATTSGAMGGIVVARAWMSLPWYMVMFLAGLQSVPTDVVEAARVDGGGNFTVLRHVVLPHINYTMLVALMLGAIGNLQLFDLIYAMTGGGPVNGTAVLSLQVYQQAFQNFDFGMASTIGVVWLIAMIIPMVIALRILMPARQRPNG